MFASLLGTEQKTAITWTNDDIYASSGYHPIHYFYLDPETDPSLWHIPHFITWTWFSYYLHSPSKQLLNYSMILSSLTQSIATLQLGHLALWPHLFHVDKSITSNGTRGSIYVSCSWTLVLETSLFSRSQTTIVIRVCPLFIDQTTFEMNLSSCMSTQSWTCQPMARSHLQ